MSIYERRLKMPCNKGKGYPKKKGKEKKASRRSQKSRMKGKKGKQ